MKARISTTMKITATPATAPPTMAPREEAVALVGNGGVAGMHTGSESTIAVCTSQSLRIFKLFPRTIRGGAEDDWTVL